MYKDKYKEKKASQKQYKRTHENAIPYVRKKYTAQDYRQGRI